MLHVAWTKSKYHLALVINKYEGSKEGLFDELKNALNCIYQHRRAISYFNEQHIYPTRWQKIAEFYNNALSRTFIGKIPKSSREMRLLLETESNIDFLMY